MKFDMDRFDRVHLLGDNYAFASTTLAASCGVFAPAWRVDCRTASASNCRFEDY
jgi:hypothetical protein